MTEENSRKLPRKIRYQEIATYFSIHPVTVAKIFKALRAEGIIKKEQSEIIINDPDGLLSIAMGREPLYYVTNKRAKTDSGEEK